MYSDGRPEVSNSLFIKNTSTNEGGGFYNAATVEGWLINVTLSNNAAGVSGGGLYNVSSQSRVTNSIVWNNSAPAGPEISGTPPIVSFSDVEGSGGSGPGWDPSVGVDGGGNIDSDPLFKDAAGGNFRLSEDSPAIDSGDYNVVTVGTDLDGDPRLSSAWVDMGPYEFQQGVQTVVVYVDDDGTGNGHAWAQAAPAPLSVEPSSRARHSAMPSRQRMRPGAA